MGDFLLKVKNELLAQVGANIFLVEFVEGGIVLQPPSRWEEVAWSFEKLHQKTDPHTIKLLKRGDV